MWGEPLQEGQRRKEDCHEQGRSRTVREVGWEGQEKMLGKPLQEGQREERKTTTEQGQYHRSRTVREVEWEGQEKM